MRYEGKIYRPWMESESLLIQVTTGCSNNNCTFCTMFKDKKFSKRKLEDIYADIEMSRHFYPNVESIFLIDGNVMVLKTEFLLTVVNKIKATFPEITNISLYSELNDLRRKSDEELDECLGVMTTSTCVKTYQEQSADVFSVDDKESIMGVMELDEADDSFPLSGMPVWQIQNYETLSYTQDAFPSNSPDTVFLLTGE